MAEAGFSGQDSDTLLACVVQRLGSCHSIGAGRTHRPRVHGNHPGSAVCQRRRTAGACRDDPETTFAAFALQAPQVNAGEYPEKPVHMIGPPLELLKMKSGYKTSLWWRERPTGTGALVGRSGCAISTYYKPWPGFSRLAKMSRGAWWRTPSGRRD